MADCALAPVECRRWLFSQRCVAFSSGWMWVAGRVVWADTCTDDGRSCS